MAARPRCIVLNLRIFMSYDPMYSRGIRNSSCKINNSFIHHHQLMSSHCVLLHCCSDDHSDDHLPPTVQNHIIMIPIDELDDKDIYVYYLPNKYIYLHLSNDRSERDNTNLNMSFSH